MHASHSHFWIIGWEIFVGFVLRRMVYGLYSTVVINTFAHHAVILIGRPYNDYEVIFSIRSMRELVWFDVQRYPQFDVQRS